MKKVSGGTPPDENVSKNTQKNVFRSIKIRKQISVKKYSEKHLPLQNPLERGGLGGAHLDICIQCTTKLYDIVPEALRSLAIVKLLYAPIRSGCALQAFYSSVIPCHMFRATLS